MKRNVPDVAPEPLTALEVARLSEPVIYIEDWLRLDDQPHVGRGTDPGVGLEVVADERVRQAIVRGQGVVDCQVYLAHRAMRLPMVWRDKEGWLRRHSARQL